MRSKIQNRLLTVFAAVAVTLALTLTGAAGAHAGPQDTASGGVWVANNSQAVATGPGKGPHYGGLYAKGFWSASGTVGYCAGDNRPGPNMARTGTNYPVPTPVTKALVTPTLGTISGDLIGQYAYVLNRYGAPQERDAAKRAAQMEAVDHALALLKFGPDFRKSSTTRKQLSPASPQSSRTLAAGYAAEAQKFAGQLEPRTLTLKQTGQQMLDLGGLEVLSPSGAAVPGLQYTAKIAGPAVFERTQTSTHTGSTGGQGTERLRVIGAGQITVTVTYHGVPRPELLHAKHSTYQNLFIAGYTTDRTVQVQLANRAQANVTTKVGATTSNFGDPVHDTVSITGAGGSDTLEVTAKLFYAGHQSPRTSSEVPTGLTPIATVTDHVTVNKQGSVNAHKMPAVQVLPSWAPGFYTWVVSYPQTALTAGAKSHYGEASETFLLQPHEVTAATQTSQEVSQIGAAIYDSVSPTSATGWTEPVLVTSKLWGPFATEPTATTEIPGNDQLVGEYTTEAIPDHPYNTEAITVLQPGWYSWSTHIAGSQSVAGWDSTLAEPNEVTLVKWQPQVHTQTSSAVAEPGVQLVDHLSVTGLAPQQSVTVHSTLWGPLETKPTEQEAPPEGTPRAGTVSTTVTADGSGSVAATTEPILLTESGWYVWTEEIPGDDLHEAWRSAWGQASETTFVTPPVLEEPPSEQTPPEQTPPEQPRPVTPEVKDPEVEIPVQHVPVETPKEELAQTGKSNSLLAILGSATAGIGLLALAAFHQRRKQDFDAAGAQRRVMG